MHRHGGSRWPRLRFTFTLAMASVFFAAAAAAQEPAFGLGEDASTLATHTLRVGVRADFLFADQLRLAGGGTAPLASRLGLPARYSATQDLIVAASVSETRFPFSFEYGVLHNLTVGVTLPLVRRTVESAADTSRRLDTTGVVSPPRVTDLSALGSFTHTNIGDIELSARFGVLDDFASKSPIRLRVSAEGVYRLGNGHTRSPNTFLDPGAGDGQSDIDARLLADVGIGPRLTISARASHSWQRPDQTTVVYTDSVFPSTRIATGVARDLGDVTQIDVTPRYRFTRFLSVAASVSQRAKGADSYAGGAPAPGWGLIADPTESYNTTRVGLGIVFSTRASSNGAIGSAPLELTFQHARIVHSSGATIPDVRLDQLGGRLYFRIF